MKSYSYKSPELKVFGIPNFEERKSLYRLTEDVMEQVPSLKFLGKRPHGARLGFKTDAEEYTLKIEFETFTPDIGMSIFSCQSALVYAGDRQDPRYLGMCRPANYQTKSFEAKFHKKNNDLEDILIWLPRNEIIANITLDFPDNAIVTHPTPYKYEKPILYYGSSITEGGCAYNVNAGYNAIISQHLDVDYINLGFSGNALLSNTQCGVFGGFADLPNGLISEAIPVGDKNALSEGEAEIICTLDETGAHKYKVRISEINRASTGNKCFTVTVVDNSLIEKTGGIVQGMSGSPIIQNGKLVGAVTHVLVNDPTTGYGIFIENMLNAAQMPMAKAS